MPYALDLGATIRQPHLHIPTIHCTSASSPASAAMKTTFALIALVAFACVARTALAQDYCHKSAFQMPCAQLEAAKKVWWKSCPGVAQVGKFVAGAGGCCTIVQKTKSADTWETYRKCEHATALYIRAFKPKAAGCATLAAKGPCTTVMGKATAGH